LGLEILADILTSPLFDEGELEKEREVVIQEIGEAADTPDDVVMESIQSLCFGDHALGRPILGTVDTVQSHTSERLKAFMTRHYAPQDMVVAVSGAVETESFVRLAEELFGARSAVDRNARSVAPAYSGGARHDGRDIEQTHIALAFPGVSVRDDDYFATRIFSECLGGGMSSRIFQSVREERGLAYSVYSYSDSFEDAGAVGAYVGADARNAAEAIGLIRAEIENLSRAPTDTEINRARAMMKATMLMGLENPASRAEMAVGQLFAHGRLLPTTEISDRLDEVSADDIRRIAAKTLASLNPSLAVVGPADFETVRKALNG
ncbi:MAG: pitrilysin family protein, partial [Parvularculaceae bacterium]